MDDATGNEWRKPTRSFANGNCVEVGDYRKSTHSVNNGQCVEVGDYRKSTRSIGNGQCVEVGVDVSAGAVIGIRDTKEAALGNQRTVITFTPHAWQQFTSVLKSS